VSLDRREALAVLRLPPSADATAIKRAYRQLVRDHHPDVGGDAAAFQELQQAYEALADHAPSARPGVRRGTPSRQRAAWTSARDGHGPSVDPDGVTWDGDVAVPGRPLDALALARRLAGPDAAAGTERAATGPPAGRPPPVTAVTATSRAPGSRLNRVAGNLSPDLTASLHIGPGTDDRGAVVVATQLVGGSRRARRALDGVGLEGGWMRTRGSASTTLRAAITPDGDPRRTALRVVEPLESLLDRLGWPLSDWTLTDALA
jgi:hypothetical protein